MGVELPAEGRSTFQRTFSVSLHVTSTSVSDEAPNPLGPRQPGQFSARAAATARTPATKVPTTRTAVLEALLQLIADLPPSCDMRAHATIASGAPSYPANGFRINAS